MKRFIRILLEDLLSSNLNKTQSIRYNIMYSLSFSFIVLVFLMNVFKMRHDHSNELNQRNSARWTSASANHRIHVFGESKFMEQLLRHWIYFYNWHRCIDNLL